MSSASSMTVWTCANASKRVKSLWMMTTTDRLSCMKGWTLHGTSGTEQGIMSYIINGQAEHGLGKE
jgi:hypothetical protein